MNARYTFESFVVGTANQAAYAATRGVTAAARGGTSTPLLIHGPSGHGATHLLHAVAHAVRRGRPTLRVHLRSAEQFMNEYLHCIRNERMPMFRQRYREHCDVLLLSDMQFVANKDSTQEEFFRTFTWLYEQQRLIVLTSETAPKVIPDVVGRLRARYAGTRIVGIGRLNEPLRAAILRRKVAERQLRVPQRVVRFLAAAMRGSVRDLEGALNRLEAMSALLGSEIDLALARRVVAAVRAQPLV